METLYHLYHKVRRGSDRQIASYTVKEEALKALSLYRDYLDRQHNSIAKPDCPEWYNDYSDDDITSSYNSICYKQEKIWLNCNPDHWYRGGHVVYIKDSIVNPTWESLGYN